MRSLKYLFALLMLVFAFSVGHPVQGEDWLLSPAGGDQDILLIDDVFPIGIYTNEKSVAVGDFDGDGAKDIAVMASEDNIGVLKNPEIFLLRGPSWKNNSRFSKEVDMQITSSYIHWNEQISVFFLDMTGDKKDELVIHFSSSVYVFQGREDVPLSLDFSEADLRIVGPVAVKKVTGGDLNNDGRGDLMIGYSIASAPARTEWHMIEGQPSFSIKTIDSSVNAVKKIIGPYSGTPKMDVRDIDENGWQDLVLSSPDLTEPETEPEVDVLFGKPDFPSIWDLRISSANVRILVMNYSRDLGEYVGTPCGDLTGDHRSELLFSFPTGNFSGTLDSFLLDGSRLSSDTKRISGYPGDPDYVPPIPILAATPSNYLSMGDFDGDGRADLLLDLNLILSSDIPPGPASEITNPSLQLSGPRFWFKPLFSDLNNDGYDDLIVYSKLEDIPGIYGGLFIVYGHRLLRDPSIHIRPRSVPSPHVALTLSVEGDPVDMMISGPITDPFRDQWIPYATTLDVTLSSPEGAKQVKAKFRNAVGRVSAEAVDTLTLSATAPQVLPFTNWVDNHGEVRAQFDCSLPTAGRVRAWVLDPRGVEIKELMNADQPAGIVTVEWDGTNASGRKVSRGVYYVVIDSNGRSQHRVIVE